MSKLLSWISCFEFEPETSQLCPSLFTISSTYAKKKKNVTFDMFLSQQIIEVFVQKVICVLLN